MSGVCLPVLPSYAGPAQLVELSNTQQAQQARQLGSKSIKRIRRTRDEPSPHTSETESEGGSALVQLNISVGRRLSARPNSNKRSCAMLCTEAGRGSKSRAPTARRKVKRREALGLFFSSLPLPLFTDTPHSHCSPFFYRRTEMLGIFKEEPELRVHAAGPALTQCLLLLLSIPPPWSSFPHAPPISPSTSPKESQIMHRVNAFRGWKEQRQPRTELLRGPKPRRPRTLRFRKTEGGIESFAEGYKIFGFQRPRRSRVPRHHAPRDPTCRTSRERRESEGERFLKAYIRPLIRRERRAAAQSVFLSTFRHEAEKKWSFSEWLPAARKVFLVGEFNAWEPWRQRWQATPLLSSSEMCACVRVCACATQKRRRPIP